ncbi:MAG: hypothetical protein ACWGN7_06630 [Thermodesulfovibrionales bacterium]
MKEEIVLREKLKLTEQELRTVVDKLQELEASLAELKDTSSEIKALKLYLSRIYPDFKEKYPEICKKLNIRQTS